MNLYRNYAIIAIACLLIGRYVIQPKQEVKQVVKIVEVEKHVKEEKKKVRTRIREIVKPDGTKETVTDIAEDSGKKETGSKESKVDSKTVAKTGSGITLGVLAIKDAGAFSKKMEYGVLTTIPIFGSLSLAATADTTKRVGLGLAVQF
jgi:hypothetical protein